MSDKFIYQNARVKSMETSLFTAQSVGRLLDCTSKQAVFRTLLDMGFGAGASVEDGNFDALFALEEEKAAEFLREFNVDGVLNAFLIQYDFLNLKALFKSRVTGNAAFFAPKGLYETDDIKSWIDQDGASDIPEAISIAVTELKSLLQNGNPSPRLADCIADKAMFKYIFANEKKFGKDVTSYFVRKADVMNVGAFLRCKRLGLPKSYFAEGFIGGGELDFLCDIYDASLDTLKEKCGNVACADHVKQVIDDGNLVAFEVAEDNALLKMWKDKKDDLFSIAPIVAYYLTRVAQIRVAKLAATGIKNGVDQVKIKERMRELYA